MPGHQNARDIGDTGDQGASELMEMMISGQGIYISREVSANQS